MLEMKLQHRGAVLDRDADAIGVLAQHEAGQLAIAGLGLHDLATGGPLLRELELGAAIADLHIEIELVEMALDHDRALRVAVLADGLDRLVDAERHPYHHIRARAPA